MDAVLNELHNSAALHALVDGNFFKFLSLEDSESYIHKSTNKSVVSVEMRSWPGTKTMALPVPIIDIRCRKGPEYCLEI